MTEQTGISNQQQMEDQAAVSEWVREQFQRANKHLAENAVLFDSVVTEESRYIAPFLAVWKIKSIENKYYWVISGDLPADFISCEHEKTARQALKRFSYNWQINAANIAASGTSDSTQLEFAKLLEVKAEAVYQLMNDDNLWQGEA